MSADGPLPWEKSVLSVLNGEVSYQQRAYDDGIHMLG